MTVIKKATFVISGRDDTARATGSAKRNVKKAAGEMKQSMSGFVSDDVGRRMSQFNEKTEKMRLLIGTAGTAVSKTSGEIAYMAGNISYLIGRFSIWEAGIVAVGAAIGAMSLLVKQSNIELEAQKDRLEKSRTALEEWTSSIIGFQASKKKELSEITDFEERIIDAQSRIQKTQEKIEGLKTRIKWAETNEAWARANRTSADMLRTSLQALQMELGTYQRELNDVQKLHEQALIKGATSPGSASTVTGDDPARLAREKAEKKRKAEEARRRREDKEKELDRAREAYHQKEMEEARERARINEHDRKIAALREQHRKEEEAKRKAHLDRIDEMEAKMRKGLVDRERKEQEVRMKIFEQEKLQREQAIRDSLDVASSAIDVSAQIGDMFDLWGVSAAKTERERQKAEAKRLAVISAIKMAYEIAEAAASWPNYAAMAQHMLAATLYAASLGKAIQGLTGGGGGGGASAGGSPRTPELRSKEKAEEQAQMGMVINIDGHLILGRDGDRFFYERAESWRQSQNPGEEQTSF